ncbi:MAG TPA: 4Fe-4S binding protein [Clostridia bacterium]|nr:4Fe-4S binding protein [Clostridia bacterium]
MQIVVLSGKGGTGKTTVAVSLAKTTGFTYVDCDVEEPNGFVFLSPQIEKVVDVTIPNPVIDRSKCITCGKCAAVCQFNALAVTRKGIMLFEKMCHGCGACLLTCPTGAITEQLRAIGKIDIGRNADIECIRGVLDVGEPMAGPVISAIKKLIADERDTIVDCAPGSSCNVVKAITGIGDFKRVLSICDFLV